jgi:predicted deacylase
MSGDLVCVPVTNVAAFWAGTRTNPVDGKNLARVFPGSADGSLSDRIAFIVGEEIIAKADLYLDLHSGGVKLEMPTLIGYDSDERSSRAAAIAFGGPVLWGSPFSSPGRTVSVAKDRGVPALYTEAFGAGRIRSEDLLYFHKGALNLLRHLQIVSGAPESGAVEWDLDGSGDIDESIASGHRGFLVPCVRLLDRVKRGDQLGIILDLHGACVETIVANRDGVVVLIHAFPVVDPNEALFLITGVRV